jgi:hypothetical protein
VGLMDMLKSALGFGGGAGGGADRGLYLYIQCKRCKDVVRVRVNMANDLQQEYVENADDVAGYGLTKGIVDSKCFRPMTLTMRFDRRRRELERSVEGGELVDQAAWEAVRAARQQASS